MAVGVAVGLGEIVMVGGSVAEGVGESVAVGGSAEPTPATGAPSSPRASNVWQPANSSVAAKIIAADQKRAIILFLARRERDDR